VADAVLDGMTEAQVNMGVDIGAAENPVEVAIEVPAAEAAPVAEEKPAVEKTVKPKAKKIKKPAEPAKEKPAAKAKPAKEKKAEVPKVADDISLIDGVGPTYKKKLESAGLTTFKQIADLDEAAITKLDEELELKGKIVSGEWVEQAKELMAGKPPRAKTDQKAAAAASA